MDNKQSEVLVVEDDPSVARMLRISLRAAGFQVASARTGGEALLALESDRPDAVVLDLGLPDEKGGVVLARLHEMDRMDGQSPHPVWVVTTALDREEASRKYGAVGPNFLAKPFDPWDLVRLLEQLISERE